MKSRGGSLGSSVESFGVKKRTLVRAACNSCRTRKSACDGLRPTCKQCTWRRVECIYSTLDPKETRHMALRRENEALKSELQEIRSFIDRLATLSEEETLASLGELENAGRLRSDVLHTPSLRILRPPARSNLQNDLSTYHPKAYPRIVAFNCPQTIARDLLSPSTPQRLEEIIRMKLDLSNLGSTPYCEPLLQELDITYWTDVSVHSDLAAAAISHYLETEHPVFALFDAGLFVRDLVYQRHDCCSRLLANALLSYAIQAFAIFDSDAWDMHVSFYEEAERLWRLETYRDTLLNLAALRLLDYAGATGGFDLRARDFSQLSVEMAERLGLHHGRFYANGATASMNVGDEARWKASVAWGFFTSTSIAALFYRRPFPKPPFSCPIPGTHNFRLPWYMGSTFTSVCTLCVIAEEALSHCPQVESSDQLPLHVLEQTYPKLLEWASGLPSCCARDDLNPHHVITLHIYYHCLVIFFVRPWMEKGLRFSVSTAFPWSPDEVFHASISQLKRILILYQLQYPESRYHAWWNPAIVYVAHAVLTSPFAKEWKFYFLICLKAYRTLSLAYPFAVISYKATLTLAMAEGKLSATKARDLLRQLFQGEGHERVRDTRNLRLYVDLGHDQEVRNKGNAEQLANDFGKLAVVEEATDEQGGQFDDA